MSKSKLILENSALTWDAKRRYKVNAVVSYSGSNWQNQTGQNSTPGIGSDWFNVSASIDGLTTDNIQNVSTVNGINATNALNTLNTGKANLSGSFFTGPVTVLPPTTGTNPATKDYADGLIVGLWNDRGNYNPSTNSNLYPTTGGSGTSGAIKKGDTWVISGLGVGVSAIIGTKIVTDGDVIRALVNTPANTDSNWSIIETNIGYVPANDANVLHKTGNLTESADGIKTFTGVYTNINGNIYSSGVLSENTTTLTPTISGQPAIIGYVNSLKVTQPVKLVIYFHGSGTNQLNPFTDPNSKTIIDKLLSEGYIVATSQAHGNSWGNQASQDDYLALYNYINTNYNVSEVTYIGHSMGGLASLSMMSKNTISKAKSWYGIMPVTNLADAYSVPSFVPDIESAYSFSGGANYPAATAGYDPQLLVTSTYSARRYIMTASPSDVLVSKANNSDLFNTKMLSGNISSSVITASGVHGDISHFIPKDVTSFIKNSVINTFNPIGSVDIFTGYRGNTTNVAQLANGVLSFANRGVSTSSPTITGRSNDSAGLILIGATNNSSASADMTFDIRENDDTDFATLNTLGFRFSRFGNSLVDIQRDGKTGFGIATPTTQIDVATGNASVLTDNITLRSNSQLVGTEVGVFFSPSSATGNIRGSRISSANDGSNNTDLRFYTGIGASITRKMTLFNTGGLSLGNTTDPGANNLSVTGNINAASYSGGATLTGTPTAPTATAGTNTTQLATTAFVLANGRPYKSYVVTASQASTSAPTITIIENGIGGIVWTRSTIGTYDGTLTGAFTSGKTFITISNNSNTNLNIKEILSITSTNVVTLKTYSAGVLTDGVIANLSIEIRVYN